MAKATVCAEHPEDRPNEEYCFGCVKRDARQACTDRDEGWRWGVKDG